MVTRSHGHEWDGKAWLADEALSRCSFEARAVWADMISLMLQSPVLGLLVSPDGTPWSDEDIISAVRGDKHAVRDALAELLRKSVASRTDSGAVYSRRLVRRERIKRAARERGDKSRTVRSSCARGAPLSRNGEREIFSSPSLFSSDPEIPIPSSNEADDAVRAERIKAERTEAETLKAEQLYQAYPRKEGHKEAIAAILKALKETSFDVLMDAVQEFARSPAGNRGVYTPHPSTWFNQERWNDDRSNWHKRRGIAAELHESLNEAAHIVRRLQGGHDGPV